MQPQTLSRANSARRVRRCQPTMTCRPSRQAHHRARIIASRERSALPWALALKLGLFGAITVTSVYLFVLPIVLGVMQAVSKLTS
ncbi:MAG: hypothetical protein GXP27_13385 [Planctomycetes bacterium]|nr:hypothetical protein [Planctomycetota bacterium]